MRFPSQPRERNSGTQELKNGTSAADRHLLRLNAPAISIFAIEIPLVK